MTVSDIFGYVRASRLHTVLGGLLLNYTAFTVAQAPIDAVFYLIMVFLLFAGVATMWQNDFDDRFRDKCQGRVFAYYHAIGVQRLANIGWTFGVMVAIVTLFMSTYVAGMMLIIMLICRFYRLTMRIPFLSMVVVALMDVTTFGFAYIRSSERSLSIVSFALMYFLMFLMRETIKDMHDYYIDRKMEYKKTIPTICGYQSGIFFIKCVAILVCMLAFLVLPESVVYLVFGFVMLSALTSIGQFSVHDKTADGIPRKLFAILPKRTLDVALIGSMILLVI